MKICEIVLRHLHNLPLRDTEQSASSSPSKKRRPAMPKVKIGLQPAVVTYPPMDTKDGPRQTTYIWCLPSSSARVVEYQVGRHEHGFFPKEDPSADLDRSCSLSTRSRSGKTSSVISVYSIADSHPSRRPRLPSPSIRSRPFFRRPERKSRRRTSRSRRSSVKTSGCPHWAARQRILGEPVNDCSCT